LQKKFNHFVFDVKGIQIFFSGGIRGNCLSKIDRIEQGLFRKSPVEAGPGFETGEKAGGDMGNFDRNTPYSRLRNEPTAVLRVRPVGINAITLDCVFKLSSQ